MKEVKVSYRMHDDIHDIHYFRSAKGYRLNNDYVITDFGHGMYIERIMDENNGYCFIKINEQRSRIFVDIQNTGDIDFTHEAVKSFFDYLLKTTL